MKGTIQSKEWFLTQLFNIWGRKLPPYTMTKTDREFLDDAAQNVINKIFEKYVVDGDVKSFAKKYLRVKNAIIDAFIEVK